MNKRDIIYIIVIICLIIGLVFSFKSCSSQKTSNQILNHNIEALTDSVKYYNGKNGELIAEKKILIGNIESLSLVNKELNDKVESMGVKNSELVAQIEGLINQPQRDTIFHLDSVYIDKNYSFPFEFSDKYRLLNGNINITNNVLGLNIKNDIVYFDYTIALKDNTIFITSDNPYVKINNISGISVPSKQKRWTLGIQAGFGVQYNLLNTQFGVGPYIGAGVSYNFSF